MQAGQYKPPFANILYKEVNHKVRYYSMKIYKTLFGEYLLEKRYGSLKNRSPTGIRQEYFAKREDALVAVQIKIQEKLKRGYKIV